MLNFYKINEGTELDTLGKVKRGLNNNFDLLNRLSFSEQCFCPNTENEIKEMFVAEYEKLDPALVPSTSGAIMSNIILQLAKVSFNNLPFTPNVLSALSGTYTGEINSDVAFEARIFSCEKRYIFTEPAKMSVILNGKPAVDYPIPAPSNSLSSITYTDTLVINDDVSVDMKLARVAGTNLGYVSYDVALTNLPLVKFKENSVELYYWACSAIDHARNSYSLLTTYITPTSLIAPDVRTKATFEVSSNKAIEGKLTIK